MHRWHPKTGSPQYELAAKSVELCAWRANEFIKLNPDKEGIFAGRKRIMRKNSQKKQRV